MASPEPAVEPSLAQESPTPTPAAAPSAEQEGPPQPQEPVPEAKAEKAEGEEAVEEEEEGECGFCLFMKAGGCRDTFVAWEECVEAAQKDGDDMVDRCLEVTANLKKCMDEHADYYAPVLRAEEAVNERAEAEAAAAAAAADDAAKSKGGEPTTDSGNKEEAVPQPAVSSPPDAGVGNDAENKEEGVPQPAACSLPPACEAKKEEAVAKKRLVIPRGYLSQPPSRQPGSPVLAPEPHGGKKLQF